MGENINLIYFIIWTKNTENVQIYTKSFFTNRKIFELLRHVTRLIKPKNASPIRLSTIGTILFYFILISLNFEILENVAQSCWFQKYAFCRGFCGKPESLVEIGSLILEEFASDKPSPCTLPKRYLATLVRV